jgi:hypothetical protein
MKQWNWDSIKSLLASRASYIEIYKKLAKNPELVTTEEQAVVDKIHKEYTYEDILSWRRLANASIKDENDKDKFEAKVTTFFTNLFSMDKVCLFFTSSLKLALSVPNTCSLVFAFRLSI